MPPRDLLPLLGLSEPLSALSHLLGALAVCAGYPLLLRRAGPDPERRALLTLYSLCVTGMFVFSASYHALSVAHPLKALFWHLDHASIWIAIAASFTPAEALLCRGRGLALGVSRLWGVALGGAAIETWFLEGLPHFVSPLLYIGMGLNGLPTVWKVAGRWDPRVAWVMLGGGGFAIAGGLMDALDAPMLLPRAVEAHELMHLCTLPAAGCFWWAALRYAAAPVPAVRADLVATPA